MNTQIVRNWMTAKPITITPQTTLPEAQQLMLEHHIRRLPVLDKDKLVGIVTRRDINRAEPWDGSTLSRYELIFMRERLKAREFMSRAIITISPDAPIGEAAQLMLDYKIDCLPVVEEGKLIGIITETDICLSIIQPENAV